MAEQGTMLLVNALIRLQGDGFPYPGGVHIDKATQSGMLMSISCRRRLRCEFDFSFSGLKTAVINLIQCRTKGHTINKSNLAASLQKRFLKFLLKKQLVLQRLGYKTIALAGEFHIQVSEALCKGL